MAPPSYQSRRKTGHISSDSNYKSFYKFKKTKLSARYPFLPKKQIEMKIRHQWERASAEKRSIICLASSGTTAKSPFKGSILQGLCKKKVPLEQIIYNGGHICNGTHASISHSNPVDTLQSSIKDPQSQTNRKQTLRSSSKNASTRRVSFNFDQSPLPSRPNTRGFTQKQKSRERRAERNKREKQISAGDGQLRKRELSFEEKKMYEFEEEGSRSCDHSVGETQVESSRTTQMRVGVKEHVFEPEQYNIESTVNSIMFTGESQSPIIAPEQRPPETTLNGKSLPNLDNKTKTSSRRNTKSPKNSYRRLQKIQDIKSKGCIAEEGKKDDGPSIVDDLDTSQSDDAGEVPWLVTAYRDSSSDDIQDDSSDDLGQDAFYEYYHKSSSESSAPTLPSLSQESEDVLASPSNNSPMFTWNGTRFTKKTSSLGTNTFDGQLPQVSTEAAEVMSVSSTESILSLKSPHFGFEFPGKVLMSSPKGSLTPPDIRADLPLLHKHKMRLQDGMIGDSSDSFRIRKAMFCTVEDAKQTLEIVSPTRKKRKMKGQEGEDIVSMTTAIKTNEQSNQRPVALQKDIASLDDSMASSNGRKILVEMNSKPTKSATKTISTRDKEDHDPKVKTRRSGRLKNKETLMNRSLTKDCCDKGGNIGQGIKKTQMTERGEIVKSDGILCDLFQPNLSSDKRSFNLPSESEFYQSCMDPVSSHLFLEENFFL